MDQIPILLGGLALFIYGMNQMGKGLELLAGNKLQAILEKLTSNKYLGILIGTLVTAIVQSSSATTVMAVGFVNSKILSLAQAVYVIMGANIGTTVTGLLLTLNIYTVASLAAFIGMIMMLFVNKRRYRYIGTILFGFGTLFIGMNIMGSAVKPLAKNQAFIDILASSTNPLVGVLIGTLFTAVIQSSSATTGILITLANSNLLTFESAFYLVLGTNIGTCITSLLASLGANNNAKRVAVVHISFNVIGTIIFTILSLVTPLTNWIETWTPVVSQQIAYLHTFFNVTTTIILIPFTDFLVKLSKEVINKDDSLDNGLHLKYLNPNTFRDTIPTIAGVKRESIRMFELTKQNLDLAIQNLLEHNEDKAAEIEYNEELIDFLNKEISRVSIKALNNQLNKQQYKQLSYYMRISSNIERLGDYSYNINDLANKMELHKVKFSQEAKIELMEVYRELENLYKEVLVSLEDNEFDLKKIRTTAIKINDYVELYRENSLSRLKQGVADPEAGLMYDKLYTYMMRYRDHLMNVTRHYTAIYN